MPAVINLEMQYLEKGFPIRKHLFHLLKINGVLRAGNCHSWAGRPCMYAKEASVFLCKQDMCARTGKGVPILILSLRPFRPPGTRRSTLGILLNSIAFRQARTTAFCAMHSFVSAVIACNQVRHRTVRPARTSPWRFDHADRIQSPTLQIRPGNGNQEWTVRNRSGC